MNTGRFKRQIIIVVYRAAESDETFVSTMQITINSTYIGQKPKYAYSFLLVLAKF